MIIVRKFNPERELYKLKYGKRNKIVLGIIILLVITTIGSTFALYQVKHSKRIIYTTVDDFRNKDKDLNLSILIDGKESTYNTFPEKGKGYYFAGADCDNGSQIDFDYGDWEIIVKSKNKDKCVINFVTKNEKTLLEYLQTQLLDLVNDDPDKNLRYIGADPSNYLWFNCNDYTKDMNEENCEKWRIIGVFNNIEKVNDDGSTTKQYLVKIIRADSIGNIAWDTSNSNNWLNASLQKSLNNNYYNNGQQLGSGKGITDATKNMIEKVRWNIGGNAYSNAELLTLKEFYALERGIRTYDSSYSSTWDGYIALIYPSDFGYATTGNDNGITREKCLGMRLYSRSGETYLNNCTQSNWVYQYHNWTITPLAVNTNYVFGTIAQDLVANVPQASLAIRPVLYLTNDIILKDGNGSPNNPYQISALP